MMRGASLAVAAVLSAMLGCSAAEDSRTVERVHLPRATDETFDRPPTVVRWREVGSLEGAIEFTRTRVFLPPNQYAERVSFADAGVDSVRLWDGTQFLERTADGFRKLDASSARALFDRALEAALLFRECDVEPSLAVECVARDRARTTAEGGEVRVDVYRVSHGRAGFERALDFDSSSQHCLGWRGSRYLDGRTLPVDCQVRFSDLRVVNGRRLPFGYVVRDGERELESISVIEYRIDDSEEHDLLKLLESP